MFIGINKIFKRIRNDQTKLNLKRFKIKKTDDTRNDANG